MAPSKKHSGIEDFGDQKLRKIMNHFYKILVKLGADLDFIENRQI